MNQNTSLIGPLLQAFFSEHLLAHKCASPQTMAAYRDTFRLLLQFVRDSQGIEPSALRVSDLDAPVYVEADLAMKEQALQKLAPAGSDAPRFKADDELLAFLATI